MNGQAHERKERRVGKLVGRREESSRITLLPPAVQVQARLSTELG